MRVLWLVGPLSDACMVSIARQGADAHLPSDTHKAPIPFTVMLPSDDEQCHRPHHLFACRVVLDARGRVAEAKDLLPLCISACQIPDSSEDHVHVNDVDDPM